MPTDEQTWKLERINNALAKLDMHSCHAGHTDLDHLRLYRAIVTEIEIIMERRPGQSIAHEKATTDEVQQQESEH